MNILLASTIKKDISYEDSLGSSFSVGSDTGKHRVQSHFQIEEKSDEEDSSIRYNDFDSPVEKQYEYNSNYSLNSKKRQQKELEMKGSITSSLNTEQRGKRDEFMKFLESEQTHFNIWNMLYLLVAICIPLPLFGIKYLK
jgi:hypothetical protein